jgi:putative SOS response-associated peptidase YedK
MAPDPKRPAPINACAETLLERPLFRGAMTRRRCLVIGDGYYEWREAPG